METIFEKHECFPYKIFYGNYNLKKKELTGIFVHLNIFIVYTFSFIHRRFGVNLR